MRPILAILMWIILVGGLAGYMQVRGKTTPVPHQEIRGASETFSLEITTTFALEPDPFALKTDAESAAPSLLIRVNGKEAFRLTDRIERGKPLRFEPVPELKRGQNEIYLEANPPIEHEDGSLALRIRLLRNSETLVEKSIWSETGSHMATVLQVNIEPENSAETPTHEH